MTESLSAFPQDDPLNPIPRVTFYPEANEVTVVDFPIDTEGSTTDLHRRFGPTVKIGNLPERLATLVDVAGPGVHDVVELAARMELHTQNVISTANRLAGMLPPELIHTERADPHVLLHLGVMVVKRATADEKQIAAFEQRSEAIKVATFRQTKEALVAADAEKQDLTQHDHGVVRFKDKDYLLILEDPGMIIAGRVISAVAGLREKQDRLQIKDVVGRFWTEMPIAERALFTNDETVLYGDRFPKALLKDAEAILESLTGMLGITSRHTGATYMLPKGELQLNFHMEPLANEDSHGLTLMYPRTGELSLRNIAPGDVERARELAAMATGRVAGLHLSSEEAVALLDDVTSSGMKRAIGDALLQLGSQMEPGNAFYKLRGIALYNLPGQAYGALSNRRVAGNRWVRGAALTGGQPQAGSTNRSAGHHGSDLRRWTFEELRPDGLIR